MIKTYQDYIEAKHETGSILSSQGFTALAQGIPSAAVGELIITQSGGVGIVNALGEDTTELLMVDRGSGAKGEPLVAIGEVLSVPVGDRLLGRSINPMGEALDGGDPLGEIEVRPIEQEAPPIYKRAKITEQLLTGVMLEDLLVPLGRGQREVVMGDAKSGKTSFLLQVLLHVHEQNMIGIYVGIGKTRAELRRINTMLLEGKQNPQVVVVAASSSDSTTMQYLAPYAGMSMAEYFRDQGKDVFLVLDDLGNHAKAHREISLLNNRLPGRDSYPGDIFYTHSRLLERAGCIAGEDGKPHTITLMPIIETIGGDVTGYVQTNLISMSDGHTLFDLETFYKGIRPAINIGLSVSRVGKQTQSKLQKYVASELRTMIASYQEAKNFVRFGAELTDKTKLLFLKGTIFEELIKQDLNTSFTFEQELIIMLGLLDGFFDPYPIPEMLDVRRTLVEQFNQPQFDQLRQALKDSAPEDVRRPLQQQLYDVAGKTYVAQRDAKAQQPGGASKDSDAKPADPAGQPGGGQPANAQPPQPAQSQAGNPAAGQPTNQPATASATQAPAAAQTAPAK